MKFTKLSAISSFLRREPDKKKESRTRVTANKAPQSLAAEQMDAFLPFTEQELAGAATKDKSLWPPRASAFERLPIELGATILSFIDEPYANDAYAPRSVSRAFAVASALGQPQISECVAMRCLQQLLSRKGPVDAAEISPLVRKKLTQIEPFLLFGVDLQDEPTKRDLLHQILRDRSSKPSSLTMRDVSGIKDLPEGLHVSYLTIWNSSIESLPPRIVVEKDLYLIDCPIQQLPADMKNIWGDLDISYSKIATLPENTHVRGNLTTTSELSTSFPPGSIVEKI